ncbi:MAG: hypothetical protein ACI9LM_003388 [Alteromonadaceae bacterium]|jgi:hypothetical protein
MPGIKKTSGNTIENQKGYRLINSKYPPIALFDDVASADEFDILYELQAFTNPRIQNELGNLNLVIKGDIPFGIDGCSYATAPFTHINPAGSRFSDGMYGVLYIADSLDTAIAETRYHQNKTFNNIKGLHYDVITMRGLTCYFSGELVDVIDYDPCIYHSTDYTDAQQLGRMLYKQKCQGLIYKSVRHVGAKCWALFTPKHVASIKQTAHFEFIYDGTTISRVETISKVRA